MWCLIWWLCLPEALALVAEPTFVSSDETTVEVHALCDLDLVLDRLALLYSNGTFLANLFHCLGNKVTDVGVAVSGDGGDLGNLSCGCDGPF